MSVWYCIPSARPPAEAQACVDAWRERGYKVALWRDEGADHVYCDLLLTGPYPGYAQAVNALVKEVLARDLSCSWVVSGGDDTLPDQSKTAAEIAVECSKHFGGTFGVMQPTADGHGIDTICGSPWMGREFCERVNGGIGPFWPDYTHCFLDNELHDVATMLGVLWKRPDLRHEHRHWSWTGQKMPAFLAEANSPRHWQKYMALYHGRRAARFPGHEPIAAGMKPWPETTNCKTCGGVATIIKHESSPLAEAALRTYRCAQQHEFVYMVDVIERECR